MNDYRKPGEAITPEVVTESGNRRSVTFEIHHMIAFKMEMVDFPELKSGKKWIQKGLDLLKKHAPRVLKYLSKQEVMAQLKDFDVVIDLISRKKRKLKRKRAKKRQRALERRQRWIKRSFKVWVQKEKAKRLILVILEGMIIPLTPILALLPGPNVFFYIPALLLYFHLRAYLGLRKVDVDELKIQFKYNE
jgi:hypothetical protein